MTERERRPLHAASAYDGMDLRSALVDAWGTLPEHVTLERLKGDASTRRYYRIDGGARGSLIVMRLPSDALSGDEGSNAAALGELPFVNVHRHLTARRVAVPKVRVDHTARGILLLEDLGDETFETRLHCQGSAHWPALYGHAVDVMAAMHRACAEPADACIAYGRFFDRKLLRWELDHFRAWGLEAVGGPLSPSERGELDEAFDGLVERVLALPQGFVHRDYQSRNLMWAPDGRLVVIDFQDALLGPVVYDLVSLMCDSYVTLDETLQRAMIARLARLRGEPEAALEQAFWLVAIHRKLKDAGRFVFIDRVRGNSDFLRWYAPSLRYVGRALSHVLELAPLLGLLQQHIPGFPDEVAEPVARTGAQRGSSL